MSQRIQKMSLRCTCKKTTEEILTQKQSPFKTSTLTLLLTLAWPKTHLWLMTNKKEEKTAGLFFSRTSKNGKLLLLPVWVSYVHGTLIPSVNFWCHTLIMMENSLKRELVWVLVSVVQVSMIRMIWLSVFCQIQPQMDKISSSNAQFLVLVWLMREDRKLNCNNSLFPP